VVRRRREDIIVSGLSERGARVRTEERKWPVNGTLGTPQSEELTPILPVLLPPQPVPNPAKIFRASNTQKRFSSNN
jgi:hypothetical protein